MQFPDIKESIQGFSYESAFERNLGWLTPEEQNRLKNARIAIAGCGGAGGFQILALARLGVGSFRICDPDTYEWTNINRQVGATASTIGSAKTNVMEQMIKSVNPDAKVEVMQEKLTDENLDRFLSEADVVLDGIDFFDLDIKEKMFKRAYEKKIPA